MARLFRPFALVMSLIMALGADIVWAAESQGVARARVEGKMDSSLKAKIESAIGETTRPVTNRFEARQRARSVADTALSVLRSEGYYDAQVEPGVTGTDPVQPLITVLPGQVFHIAGPVIEWLDPAPPEAIQALGTSILDLKSGQVGASITIVSAEGRVAAALKGRGYADTEVAARQVIVDHADRTVQPTFRVRSGDLIHLDGLTLATAGRTREDWLQRLKPWTAGEVFDPAKLADFELRLTETGVYDSVNVALAPLPEVPDGAPRPVIVQLSDRPPRQIEFAASYATSDGFGMDARWTQLNRLGVADRSSLFAKASSLDSRVGASLVLPNWRQLRQSLTVNSAIYTQITPAYKENGATISVDRDRWLNRHADLTTGASLDYITTRSTDSKSLQTQAEHRLLSGVLGALVLDYSDDPLDPHKGWRAETRLEPTLITGSNSLAYFKASAQGTGYIPLGSDGKTLMAGRLKLGSIIGGSLSGVPASRRYYSGGGGSVRGYVYQAIGPHLANNTPEGGLGLFEASGEVRHQIAPKWGLAGFVDLGSISSDPVPTFKDLSIGVGAGLRYNLGFGPLRLDLAIPLNRRSDDPKYQIYVSIGQSF